VLGVHAVRSSVLLRARGAGAALIVFGGADGGTAGGGRCIRALQEVAAAASAPCLLVRDPLVHPPVRVLLPLSAGEIGQDVLADACGWLASLRPPASTELQVLHVASGPREWRGAALDLDREVRRARGERAWSGRLGIRHDVAWGPAAHEEILRVAAREAPDLVVLGPRAETASPSELPDEARTILIGRLPCSVLVLPGTLPRRADADGTGAPGASAHPAIAARDEPPAIVELAAGGD
jgi:hypothetical protein